MPSQERGRGRPELTDHGYGKGGIRLLWVQRERQPHEIRDLTLDVRVEAGLRRAYTEGDNRGVVPTDTMKNAVYAAAAELPLDEPEALAAAVGRRLLERHEHLDRVTVTARERPWDRIEARGGTTPHAFHTASDERRVAIAAVGRDRIAFTAGIDELAVLKTTGSAFEDFPRDDLTTLPDAPDRLLATVVSARWDYAAGATTQVAARYATVRDLLLEAFAVHASRSVQHTLHAMGEAVIDAVPEIQEIRLSLPNRHHLPVDALEKLGIDDRGTVLLPVDEPFGVIEGTLRRT